MGWGPVPPLAEWVGLTSPDDLTQRAKVTSDDSSDLCSCRAAVAEKQSEDPGSIVEGVNCSQVELVGAGFKGAEPGPGDLLKVEGRPVA